MKATIEGVEVEGTPEEIAALIKCLRTVTPLAHVCTGGMRFC